MPGDTAIDFARSSVTWLLPEQPSRGRFALDAGLKLPDGETFYLCAQVFAGDVYGEGALFRDPPYEFSAAFSQKQYVIFRDTARGQAREDSCGAIADRFREVRLDVARVAAVPVSPHDPQPGAFSARVRLDGAELEFPVRHFNWRTDGRFQGETGPVLVCIPGGGEPVSRLRRAYAAWGSRDRVHFLIDERRLSEPGERWPRQVALSCEVSLLRCAP